MPPGYLERNQRHLPRAARWLQRLFDPVQMVQESLIDVGPAVSQRLIEALGGQLRLRQTRHELSFLVTLPAMP